MLGVEYCFLVVSSTVSALPTGVAYIQSPIIGVSLMKNPSGFMMAQGTILIHNNSGSTQTLYLWNGTSSISTSMSKKARFNLDADENYFYAQSINY